MECRGNKKLLVVRNYPQLCGLTILGFGGKGRTGEAVEAGTGWSRPIQELDLILRAMAVKDLKLVSEVFRLELQGAGAEARKGVPQAIGDRLTLGSL